MWAFTLIFSLDSWTCKSVEGLLLASFVCSRCHSALYFLKVELWLNGKWSILQFQDFMCECRNHHQYNCLFSSRLAFSLWSKVAKCVLKDFLYCCNCEGDEINGRCLKIVHFLFPFLPVLVCSKYKKLALVINSVSTLLSSALLHFISGSVVGRSNLRNKSMIHCFSWKQTFICTNNSPNQPTAVGFGV